MPEESARTIDVHAVILSWPGFEAKALTIEQALQPSVRRVTVIHSLTGKSDFVIPEHWRVLPDGAYYGVKFAESLRLHDGGIMLQIQADASYRDWVGLARRCVSVHERFTRCGVWTPEIHWSSFKWKRAFRSETSMKGVSSVSLTDGIVWSISEEVIQWLRQRDYQANPLGWGIELSAAAYCRVNDLLVLHDRRIVVAHPQGTSYPIQEASRQQLDFIAALDEPYRIAAKEIVHEFHRERSGVIKRTIGNALLEARRFIRHSGFFPGR